MKFKSVFLVALLLTCIQPSINAQIDGSTNKRFVHLITGYSPNSIILFGKTPSTKTYYSYIGFGKRIKVLANEAEIYVTRGIIPFTEYEYPKRDNANIPDIATGFGISPLGYKYLLPRKTADFYGSVTGGIMYMNKTFPTDKGRRLNYTFDFTFGIKKAILENTFISLGYRFHHISNAQTGRENPGIDSNFLFISIKHFTHVD